MAKRKLKLERKFNGIPYKFVGSRGKKSDADKFAETARKGGKSVRVIKRGSDSACWHIFEKK